jgi:hypothetical protein
MFFRYLLVLSLIIPALARAAEEAPDGVSLSGFADAQIRPESGSGNSYGFLINDGAVYVNAKKGDISALIDIPFSFQGTTSPAFDVGLNQAQAFITWTHDSGFSLQIGQFDALLGFEDNDALERRFADFGIVSNNFQLSTHLGVQANYAFNEENILSLLWANPNGAGARSTGSHEYGILYSLDDGQSRASAGLTWNKDAASGGSTLAVDAIVGVTLGALQADVEMALKDTPGIAELGFGIGLHGQYDLTDKTNLAVRLEYVSNAPDTSTTPATIAGNMIGMTMGPQYKINENVRAHLDYAFTQLRNAGVSTNTHSGVLSVVAGF